jgi:putative MATE family efflux protein
VTEEAGARDRPVARSPREQALIEGPIAPTLVRFALPLLATNLLHALTGTWAALWVSRELGEYALTAVANTTIFMWMVMGAVMGLGTSAGVAIGQSLGAGDRQGIRRVVGTTVSTAFGFGLVMAALGWILTPTLLQGMRMPQESLADGITYMRWVCMTMPTFFVYVVMLMMLRGTGDARTPFRFNLVWIGLTLILTPLMIAGSGRLPGLGIAGAAIAGWSAHVIALVAMVLTLMRKRSPIALRGPQLRHLIPHWPLVNRMARRGAPMALESVLVQGAYFVLLGLVNRHGADTAAAYSAAAQLWGYVQMPASAVASSMTAMAAMNIGAQLWPRVERIAWRGCIVGVSLTSLATVVVYLLEDVLLGLFVPRGGEMLAQAREINAIVLWGWIALGITSSLCAVVRANSAMMAPTLIFAVTMWIFRVPCALALEPWLHEAAIWWSFPAGTLSSALLAWAYYRWGRWRENRLMMAGIKR